MSSGKVVNYYYFMPGREQLFTTNAAYKPRPASDKHIHSFPTIFGFFWKPTTQNMQSSKSTTGAIRALVASINLGIEA
jgi:hypothetical protein